MITPNQGLMSVYYLEHYVVSVSIRQASSFSSNRFDQGISKTLYMMVTQTVRSRQSHQDPLLYAESQIERRRSNTLRLTLTTSLTALTSRTPPFFEMCISIDS